MNVQMSMATLEALRNLPTPVRPRVDASDVWVPEGYKVEPVVAGLSFPCALCLDPEDGTLFVAEGGSTWPTRPYMTPRIWRMAPGREPEVFAVENLGGPRGMVVRDGHLYVSVKGGYDMRVTRHDLRTRERVVLVDGLPSGGWHEPGGPVFGPDGLMYFGNGSVALAGTVLPEGFTVDIAKHPEAHDVPGEDITLTGNTVWSRDPRMPFPFLAETGPFKPFGTPARKGEVIRGELKCNSAVWRSKPDGSDLELLAWGIRNPYGLAFGEDGFLYATDNDMEEKGERAVGEDPDRIWRIKNSKVPPGEVVRPEWFGYPDMCADGLPVWDNAHIPIRGQRAEPLLADPPPWAGPAAYLFEPHTALGKLAFSRSDAFGYRGQAFVCQFGTYAPLNTNRERHLRNGFQVVTVDFEAGTHAPFMRNHAGGPASATPGSGGIERPVDVAFHPDGRSLYVLDFGNNTANRSQVVAYAHTGVVWRVTRR